MGDVPEIINGPPDKVFISRVRRYDTIEVQLQNEEIDKKYAMKHL